MNQKKSAVAGGLGALDGEIRRHMLHPYQIQGWLSCPLPPPPRPPAASRPPCRLKEGEGAPQEQPHLILEARAQLPIVDLPLHPNPIDLDTRPPLTRLLAGLGLGSAPSSLGSSEAGDAGAGSNL